MLQRIAVITCLIHDAQKIPAPLPTAKMDAEEGGRGEVLHFMNYEYS